MISIIGLGYVGLTLAVELSESGYVVVGIDKNSQLVNDLKNGKTDLIETVIQKKIHDNIAKKRLSFTNQLSLIKKSTVIIVCVGTPVFEGTPLLDDLRELFDELVKHIEPNSSIVLRSTVPVGHSTLLQNYFDNLKIDIKISFAPERTIEGNALAELRLLPQIIASPISAEYEKIAKIFSALGCETIHVKKIEEAEFGKLISNIWRDFTFAFSNELYWIAQERDINLSNVINTFNYNYPRNQIPKYGPVSGPCLSKDIFIFNSSMKIFNLGTTAREKNKDYIFKWIDKIIYENKITHDVELCIGIYGLAFKGNPPTADYRESHVLSIIEELGKFSNLKISIYDPEIREVTKTLGHIFFLKKEEVLKKSDIIIITSNHSEFIDLNFRDQIRKEKSLRNLVVYELWQSNQSE